MNKTVLMQAVFGIAVLAALGSPIIGHPSILVTPAHAGCDDDAAPGVDWSECRKRNLIMSGLDFSGANFLRADLSSSDLRDSNLSEADFTKANLVRASLGGSKAQKTNFTGIIASRTDFSGGDFSDALFNKAETSRSDFSDANLSGADMSKAEFSRAMFSGANVNGVSFDFTNLARADFRNAEFETPPTFANAYLFMTRIDGVDLSAADDLNQWQINMACGDEVTVLPADISRPESWPCENLDDE